MEAIPEVLIDPDYLRDPKIHPTILGKIRKKMMANPDFASRPKNKAKKEWLENCEVDGVRYGVTCHKREGNVIMITFAKPLRQR